MKNITEQETSTKANKVKRSPIPIYIACVVWVLYAVFSPIYQVEPFLLIALVSLAAFLLVYWLFPYGYFSKQKEKMEVSATLPEPVVSTLEESEQAIVLCGNYYGRIKQAKTKLFMANPELSFEAGQLERMLFRTSKYLEKYPNDATHVLQLTNQFGVPVVHLLEYYLQLHEQKDEQVMPLAISLSKTLSAISAVYEKLLQQLYLHDTLDIANDLNTLTILFEAEGVSSYLPSSLGEKSAL